MGVSSPCSRIIGGLWVVMWRSDAPRSTISRRKASMDGIAVRKAGCVPRRAARASSLYGALAVENASTRYFVKRVSNSNVRRVEEVSVLVRGGGTVVLGVREDPAPAPQPHTLTATEPCTPAAVDGGRQARLRAGAQCGSLYAAPRCTGRDERARS